MSSDMWRVFDVSKHRSDFIFKGQRGVFLDCCALEDEDTLVLWNLGTINRATRRHTPEDLNFLKHRYGNLIGVLYRV